MVTEMMIEAMTAAIKENLKVYCGEMAEGSLNAATAEQVSRAIQKTVSEAGKAGFKAYLEAKEEPRDIIVVDG